MARWRIEPAISRFQVQHPNHLATLPPIEKNLSGILLLYIGLLICLYKLILHLLTVALSLDILTDVYEELWKKGPSTILDFKLLMVWYAFKKLKFRGRNGANSVFHFHLVSRSQFAKCYHACTRICLGCNAKHTHMLNLHLLHAFKIK